MTGTAVAVFFVCVVGFLSVTLAAEPANNIDLSVVPPDKFTGEPYVLAGRRLVFTSWYYVRPGGYAWKTPTGESVTVTRKVSIGPWEAHYERKWDTPRGIRLTAQRPLRHGQVIQSERPWDAKALSIKQVLKDGDKYRAWGTVEDKDGLVHHAYYESTDGLNWKRPSLGLIEYAGSKDNNLIADFPGTVFIDPSAEPNERYKSVGGEVEIDFAQFKEFAKKHPDRWEARHLRTDRQMEKPILTVTGFVSSDGLTWRKLPEPFTVEHSDTQVVAGHNAQRRKYFIFTRNYFVGPRTVGANGSGADELARRIQRIRTTFNRLHGERSVRRFPAVTARADPALGHEADRDAVHQLLHDDPRRAADHHLLFPTVWDTATDATQLEMAASHDARVWNWVPGGSLMETQNFGEFDGGCMFWSPSLIELPSGDFALPYTGFSYPHKYPRKDWKYGWGYAVWPKGRIVALEAPEEGEFTCVGLIAPGRTLRINAITDRAGSIRVSVVTRDGQTLPGRSFEDAIPIVGDQYRAAVRWKAGDQLGNAPDQPICLRFKIDHAKIFGLDFE